MHRRRRLPCPARSLARRRLAAVAIFGAASVALGCPSRGAPRRPTLVASQTAALPHPAVALAPTADDTLIAAGGRTVTAHRGGAVRWTRDVPADAGPVAATGDLVAVALAGVGPLEGLPHGLRGEPGAALLGLGLADGARRWLTGIGATEWVVVRAVVPAGDGVAVAGSFAGTLRVGDRVVTSAGGSDGFWARVGPDGAVRTLGRMGGTGADAIAGVAALPDGGLALAGTYADAAELGDLSLAALYPDVALGDGFVARLGPDDAVVWARTWGGPAGDACAGVVAIGDELAFAGTGRGVVEVAGRRVDTAGNADGVVGFFDAAGAVRGAFAVGGDDYDGLTAIAAVGDEVAVAGWYSGTLRGPGGAPAQGPDDPFVALVGADGVHALLPVSAEGAAAIPALAGGPALVVAIDHTGRASFAGASVPTGPAAIALTRGP